MLEVNGMPEEKKRIENAAERTGEAVGKGIKKGAKAVVDFGKGVKKEIEKKEYEAKLPFFSPSKKEKCLLLLMGTCNFIPQ